MIHCFILVHWCLIAAMGSKNTELAQHNASLWLIVIAGLVALAVAMGIGRFAFTPLMPLMLRDGTINATTGAEWAAANYLVYSSPLSQAPLTVARASGSLRYPGCCLACLGQPSVDLVPWK